MAKSTVAQLLRIIDDTYTVLFDDALALRDHKALEKYPLHQAYAQDYIKAIAELRGEFLKLYDHLGKSSKWQYVFK